MKKRLPLLLAVLMMIFALAACADSGKAIPAGTETAREESAEKESEPKSEEPGAEPETEQPVAEPETEDPAAEPETEEEEKTEAESGSVTGMACPSVNGRLQVIGSQLCDSHGSPVQLRGISTHGLAWFPEYVNPDCVSELKSWGANVLRLALYTAESGGYCTDGDPEALKDRIRAGVEYAAEADLYVIVDWHVLSEGTPTVYQEEAEAFFDEMSAEFAGRDNVLYEICNEPNTASWDEIKAYAEDILPIIRANDPDAVVIVGTPTWSQDVDQAAADPIIDWDNVMYTLHFYAASHREELRGKMTAAAEAGLPIFVTEFGICDASGSGNLDLESADAWISRMNEYGISYVAWNLSNKDESSAILAPGVSKTSGFSYEDLSESGQWVYDLLSSAAEGTADLSAADGTADLSAADSSAAGESREENPAADGLTAVLHLDSSWEGDGGTYFLYTAEVKNTSGAAIESWEIQLAFDGPAELSDEWNGSYSLDGNTLTIQNADYNGSLDAGESAEDIGFIVIGGTNPQVTGTQWTAVTG